MNESRPLHALMQQVIALAVQGKSTGIRILDIAVADARSTSRMVTHAELVAMRKRALHTRTVCTHIIAKEAA